MSGAKCCRPRNAINMPVARNNIHAMERAATVTALFEKGLIIAIAPNDMLLRVRDCSAR